MSVKAAAAPVQAKMFMRILDGTLMLRFGKVEKLLTGLFSF